MRRAVSPTIKTKSASAGMLLHQLIGQRQKVAA
jgi:hypothetical protein